MKINRYTAVFLICAFPVFSAWCQTLCTSFGNYPPAHTATTSQFPAHFLFGTTYTLTNPGYLTALGLNGRNTGSGVQMAIYTDASGNAGNLVAYTGTGTVLTGDIVIPVLTPTMIPAGVYWIMANYQTQAQHVTHAPGTGPIKVSCYKPLTFGNTPPSSTVWSITTAAEMDYWAEVNTINATPSSTICLGSPITLTAAAVNPSATTSYSWSTGSTASAIVVSPTTTTIYTLSTISNSCASTKTIQVTVNPPPNLSFSTTSPTLCAGQNVTISATGAATYFWYPGPLMGSNVVVSPTTSTQYTVFGFSQFGCSNTATTGLVVTAGPTVVASNLTGSVCSGNSVVLNASGATTYTWNAPGGNPLSGPSVTVIPLTTGVYTVFGQSGVCVANATVPVTVDQGPQISLTSSAPTICPGQSSTITAQVTGAAGYTWLPSGAQTLTIVVSPTASAQYTLVTKNSLGCVASRTIQQSVSSQPPMTISASSSTICAGVSTTLSASGASGYSWSPGSAASSSVVVSPTSSAIYTVTGTIGSCQTTETIQITVSPGLNVSISPSQPTVCVGNAVTLVGSGATNYTWTTPQGSSPGSSITVYPQSSTTYSLLGATAGSCANTATIFIGALPVPVINLTASSTTICIGASATLTASGANTYLWYPISQAGSVQVVSPNYLTTYTAIGIDNFGCSSAATINIWAVPMPLFFSVTVAPPLICAGDEYTVSASGANSYTWLPPSGSPTVANSITGQSASAANLTYSVLGANAGCSYMKIFFVNVYAVPNLTPVSAVSQTACPGNSVSLEVSGAGSYTWQQNSQVIASGASVAVTSPGTYSVIGSSSLGCIASKTLELVGAPLPTVSIGATATLICSGAPVALSASGANGYTWSPGGLSGSTHSFSPNSTIQYSVSGNNNFGCLDSTAITISVVPAPSVQVTASTNSICSGQTSTLSATGAVTYSWLPVSISNQTIAVTPTTSTSYTIIGSNGVCADIDSISVQVAQNPVISIAPVSWTLCSGDSVVLAGQGAATYTWFPGGITSQSMLAAPAANTTYTVAGTDGLGCSDSETVSVRVNPTPTVTVQGPSIICSGNSHTLTAVGAQNYTWLPGPISGPAISTTLLAGTNYTLIGADSLGCLTHVPGQITVIAKPIVTAAAAPSVICSGQVTTITPLGAASFTLLPGGASGGNFTVSPASTTNYTVVGGSGACLDTGFVTIPVVASPPIFVSVTEPTICAGHQTQLSANGASTYTWLPGGLNASSIIVSPTASVIYTLVANISGCRSETTIVVSVEKLPNITVQPDRATICSGETVTLTASGAHSFTWSTGANSPEVVLQPTANISLIVHGSSPSGCKSLAVFPLEISECVSLKESEIEGITIYPNPVNSILELQLLERYIGGMIGVYDITGRKLCLQTIEGKHQRISVTKWPNGLLNVVIYDPKGEARTIRIIKN